MWLKRIEVTTYTTKGIPSFSETPFLRISSLSVLYVEKSKDRRSFEKFPGQHVKENEALLKCLR